MMNSILIHGTATSPEIIFTNSGKLGIKGRSYDETPTKFYDPLIKWCGELNTNDVIINFELDYLNTTSSKCILKLLTTLEENSSIMNLTINWFYEDEDEEILEMGEIYEENLEKGKFNFYITEDITMK